jgi:hypothetical protein
MKWSDTEGNLSHSSGACHDGHETAAAGVQGAALESVQRLVQTFVRPEMRRAGRALDAACAAAAGCRFEETDAVADEAVYMQIVMLLRTCLGCDAGAIVNLQLHGHRRPSAPIAPPFPHSLLPPFPPPPAPALSAATPASCAHAPCFVGCACADPCAALCGRGWLRFPLRFFPRLRAVLVCAASVPAGWYPQGRCSRTSATRPRAATSSRSRR